MTWLLSRYFTSVLGYSPTITGTLTIIPTIALLPLKAIAGIASDKITRISEVRNYYSNIMLVIEFSWQRKYSSSVAVTPKTLQVRNSLAWYFSSSPNCAFSTPWHAFSAPASSSSSFSCRRRPILQRLRRWLVRISYYFCIRFELFWRIHRKPHWLVCYNEGRLCVRAHSRRPFFRNKIRFCDSQNWSTFALENG